MVTESSLIGAAAAALQARAESANMDVFVMGGASWYSMGLPLQTQKRLIGG
jgi:dihydrofolate reductase